MRAATLALAVLCAVAAASPGGAQARESRLPVPPIPPAHPPLADAPIPNADVFAPLEATRRTSVTLDMSINRRSMPSVGAGYGPGARHKFDDDRKLLNLPGILVRVPFP